MTHGFSPGVLVALALVVVLIAGSYWLARKQQGQVSQRGARSPRRGTRPHGATSRNLLSAGEAKAATERLLTSGAGWPQIVAALNPSNNAEVNAELQKIRGPHMFAPATAIKVIHHGCEVALHKDSRASALSGIRAARQSMERVTRLGD
jgi:hypothetical protein